MRIFSRLALLLLCASPAFASDPQSYSSDRLQQLQNRLSHSRILIRPDEMRSSADERLRAVRGRFQSAEDALLEALELSSKEFRGMVNQMDAGRSFTFDDVKPGLSRVVSAIEHYLYESGSNMLSDFSDNFSFSSSSDLYDRLVDHYGRWTTSVEVPSLLDLEQDARSMIFGRELDRFALERMIGSMDRSAKRLGRKALVRR